jgi:hypothetical protein
MIMCVIGPGLLVDKCANPRKFRLRQVALIDSSADKAYTGRTPNAGSTLFRPTRADLFLNIDKHNKATLEMGHQRGWVCLLTQSLSKHPHPH